MSARPLLVLDFDGVIVDSTEECVVVAWNAWVQYTGQGRVARVAEDVPAGPRACLRTQRDYVRTAGEYLAVLAAHRDGRAIRSQAEYDAAVQAVAPHIAPFGVIVYDQRARLRAQDPAHWMGLHTIYDGIGAQLHSLWPDTEPYVVTGKDAETVLAFYQRLELPLPPERIFDKDAGRNKRAIILGLARTHGLPAGRVVFVDDNVMHLLPLHEAGCQVVLATWGYHTDEHLALADQHRLPRSSISWLAGTVQAMFTTETAS